MENLKFTPYIKGKSYAKYTLNEQAANNFKFSGICLIGAAKLHITKTWQMQKAIVKFYPKSQF